RHADRAPPRRLFRHGDDRVWPGLLLHRIPVELGHRRRRRPARLLAPAARLRRVPDRYPVEREQFLLFRSGLLRAGRRRDGLHPALAVRPHDARNPRERAPRALPGHSDRAAYLDRLHAVLLLRRVRGRAVRAAQQLRRSEGPALQPVRRLRDDGGDGRDAELLGTAARRRGLRRAAGLPVQRHGELDVLRRLAIHARRSVLPARPARSHPGESHVMSFVRVENVSRRFGNLVAVNGVSMSVEAGELRAVIGPNGAGKTTFFNMISGFLMPSAGRIVFDGDDITALPPAQRVWRGIARTFQITEVFPELTVRENLRIAVESASGFRLRFWQSAKESDEVGARVAELLQMGGLTQ